MSLADDFDSIQVKGAPGAPAQSLASQWDATPTVVPAAAPQPQAAQPSFMDQLGHQLGLTARAGVTGLTALPAMVGNAANSAINLGTSGINSAFGTHIPQLQMPSQVIQNGMDAAGFAKPQNATERVVNAAASGMAAVPTGMGLGGVLSRSASPVAAAVGNGLQAAPGMQIMGAAGAGAGSQGAAELGLNPWWQMAGGILGGTAGVVGGSGLTAAARGLGNRLNTFTAPPMSPAAAAAKADIGVDRTISDLGPQGAAQFTPSEIGPLKTQVAPLIQQNPNVNPAAAVRAQDFRNLGMQPTLGQITRDPMQFAQEMNMRGIPDVGAPLTMRFNGQNTQLQRNLFSLAGQPQDAYQAGTQLQNSLKSIDDQMRSQVSAAYSAARASSGKNLDVPLQGVAQDYAQVLNDFGDKVPSGVQNNFNQLGLMGGTQQKTFSIENAENLLKVINDNMGNDNATNTALGQLRNSVKTAILSADDQGGVYAPARALAAKRFALQEQVPALEAAADGNVKPDAFVNKFVLNGDTNSVLALSDLLKQHSPATLSEMRNQVNSRLAQGAFGQNAGGDASFAPNRYATALNNFGDAKLGAFYTPDEIAQLHTIGRVGGYMNSFPSAAPVNTSNTASAITGLLGTGIKKVPYVGPLIQGAQNRAFVQRALAGSLGDAPMPAPPAPMVHPNAALANGLLRAVPPNRFNSGP